MSLLSTFVSPRKKAPWVLGNDYAHQFESTSIYRHLQIPSRLLSRESPLSSLELVSASSSCLFCVPGDLSLVSVCCAPTVFVVANDLSCVPLLAVSIFYLYVVLVYALLPTHGHP